MGTYASLECIFWVAIILLFFQISSYDIKYFLRYIRGKNTVTAHFAAAEQPCIIQSETHHNHSTFCVFSSNTVIKMTKERKKQRHFLRKGCLWDFGLVKSFITEDQIQCQINILVDSDLTFKEGLKVLWSRGLRQPPASRGLSAFPWLTGSGRSRQALGMSTFIRIMDNGIVVPPTTQLCQKTNPLNSF